MGLAALTDPLAIVFTLAVFKDTTAIFVDRVPSSLMLGEGEGDHTGYYICVQHNLNQPLASEPVLVSICKYVF